MPLTSSPVTDKIPSFDAILEARKMIATHANHTPVLTSRSLNSIFNTNLFFKCENFQRAGAFKFRGACNVIMSLDEADAKSGVATHSSGNHAQAVALASKIRGIQAFVVMPENAPKVKVKAVKAYGAEVIFCKPTLTARESKLEDVLSQTGAHFIHPYNHHDIIAGQGTCALEFLDEVPDLDIILTPVGGGGLLSGTAIAVKNKNPSIKVIGTEPEIADDAFRSFKAGRLIKIDQTDTVADGLRTSLGDITFSVITRFVDDIVTVSESSIIRDMRLIWERLNIIIEASCAVPVSAVADQKLSVTGKKVGIILTGGNVDLEKLPWQE